MNIHSQIVFSIFCVLMSCSIGFVLMVCIYWKYMHCTVDFENIVVDGPQALLILAIVGFILSLL